MGDRRKSQEDLGWGDFFTAAAGVFAGVGALAYGISKFSASNDRETSATGGEEQAFSTSYNAKNNKFLDNRDNQCNPNHMKSGPGRPAGYPGLGTKDDLDNHSRQLNPNSSLYGKSRNSD